MKDYSIIWRNPVYNRTIEQVESAKADIKDGKSTMVNSDNPYNAEYSEGCLNSTTLNRIESNIEFLDTTLQTEYKYESVGNYKRWDDTDIFTLQDSNRIINNLRMLYETIGVTPSTQLPMYMRDYRDINTIERLTFEYSNILEGIQNKRYLTGAYIAGEKYTLPKGGVT